MAASPYGLSIVLDFEDNASDGMNSAASAFSNLSGSADALTMGIGTSANSLLNLNTSVVGMSVMGSQLQNWGEGLIGMLGNVANEVVSTSSQFENFNITLSALYGSGEEAGKQINKLFEFAKHSPFEVGDLTGMVVTLKSQGLEAFDEITSAATGARQTTMEWIGDLQSFRPEATATQWKLAIQNFLSGSDSVSAKRLRNILDVGELSQFIGHDLGKTVEERMQSLTDIVQKIGVMGLMKEMEGTWSITLSNMEDTWSQFAYRIGFGNKNTNFYSSAVSALQDILGLEVDLLANDSIIEATSEAFNGLVSPLVSVAEVAASIGPAFASWLSQHPQVIKWATGLTAIGGAGLYATGSLLRLSAGALNWIVNVQRLGGLQGLFGFLADSINLMSIRMAGFGSIAGLAFLAWKNDFYGLRTYITQFGKQFSSIFKTVMTDIKGGEKTIKQSLTEQGLGSFIRGLESARDVAKSVMGDLYTGFQGFFDFFGVNLPNFNAQTFNLKEQLNDLGNSLYDKFGGKKLDEIKEKYGELFNVAGKVGGAFLTALAATTLLSGAFTLLGASGSRLIGNFSIIAHTLFSPMGLIGMGLSAIVAGYTNNFLGLHDAVAPIVDKVKTKFSELKESFTMRDSEGKNSLLSVIGGKIKSLYDRAKSYRVDTGSIIRYTGSISTSGDKLGISLGQVLARGIASGLILFGNPIQKALGLTFFGFTQNLGGMQDGVLNFVEHLINAKDLLLEMSTGYGPKAQSMAEKFGLKPFAEGLVTLKRGVSDFFSNFMKGFAQSNSILMSWVKDLFPNMDFSLKGILNAFGNLGKKVGEAFGNGGKFSWVSTALGHLASAATTVAGQFAIFGTIGTLVFSALGKGAVALGAGMLNALVNPLSWATLALMAYTTNFAGFRQKVDTFKKGIEDVFDFVKVHGDEEWSDFTNSEGKIIKLHTEGIKALSDAWENRKAIISSAFDGLYDGVKNTFKSVEGLIRNVFNLPDGTSLLNSLGDKILELGGVEGLKDKFHDFGKSIGGVLSKIVLLLPALGSMLAINKLLGTSFSPISGGLNLIKTGAGLIGSSIKSLGNTVKNFFIDIFNTMQSYYRGIYEATLSFAKNVGNAITNAFKGAGEAIGAAAGNIEEAAGDLTTVVVNFVTDIVSALVELEMALMKVRIQTRLMAMEALGKAMLGGFLGAAKMVLGLNAIALGLGVVSAAALSFGTLVTSDWEELNERIKQQPDLLHKVAAGWGWFTEKLEGSTKRVTDFISGLDVSKIVENITRTLGTGFDAVTAIITGTNGYNGLADAGGKFIANFFDGMDKGIDRALYNLGRIFTSVTTSIERYAPSVGRSIGNMLTKALKFVASNTTLFLKSTGTIMRSFLDGMLEHKDEITENVSSIVSQALEWVKIDGPDLINKGGDLILSILEGLDGHDPEIEEAFQRVAGTLSAKAGEIVDKVKPHFEAALSGLFKGMGAFIMDLLGDLSNDFGNLMNQIFFDPIQRFADLLSKLPFLPDEWREGLELVSRYTGAGGVAHITSDVLHGNSDMIEAEQKKEWTQPEPEKPTVKSMNIRDVFSPSVTQGGTGFYTVDIQPNIKAETMERSLNAGLKNNVSDWTSQVIAQGFEGGYDKAKEYTNSTMTDIKDKLLGAYKDLDTTLRDLPDDLPISDTMQKNLEVADKLRDIRLFGDDFTASLGNAQSAFNVISDLIDGLNGKNDIQLSLEVDDDGALTLIETLHDENGTEITQTYKINEQGALETKNKLIETGQEAQNVSNTPANVTVTENGASAASGRVQGLIDKILSVPRSWLATVKATVEGMPAVSALKGMIEGIKDKVVTITAKVAGAVSGAINTVKSWFGRAEGGIVKPHETTLMNEEGGEIVDLPAGSRVYPHDESVAMSYNDGYNDAMAKTKALVAQNAMAVAPATTAKKNVQSQQSTSAPNHYDYSVHLGEGAIQLRVDNANGEADYKAAAEKMWKYIMEIQKRNQMARR